MASTSGEQHSGSPMAAGADPPVHRDAKLMMANGRGECQMLKDLVNKEDPAMMMVVMAASNSGPSAAATASPPVVAAMHPLLLASACSGDWKAINFLLNRAEAQADPVLVRVCVTNVSQVAISVLENGDLRSISVNGGVIVTRLREELRSGRSRMPGDDIEYELAHGGATPCGMES
uniref:Uncharacterized protein n=1 Tax=Oryza brachyantha TaxID=4533 RepID=J3MWL1_ORYBR